MNSGLTLLELILYPGGAVLAFLLTVMLVPMLRHVAPRLGLIDHPGGRRIHKEPIPRCGGIALMLGFHAGCALYFLAIRDITDFAARLDPAWWGKFMGLSMAVTALGLMDDRFQVSPRLKLLGQVVLSIMAYLVGFRVNHALGMSLPLYVDVPITLFWLVGAMNAFNLIDGMDGVAGGLGAVAAFSVAGQLVFQHFPGDAIVPLCLGAACVGFLIYNFHPASIFLGDSGSMFIGFSVAALAISTGSKGTTLVSMIVPVLVVGVPAFDTFLAIWRRSVRKLLHIQRKTGETQVFNADADHLHHRLLRSGRSQRQVAVILYSLAAALAAVGFVSMALRSYALAIYMMAALAATYVVVRHLAFVELWDSANALMHGISKPSRRELAVILYPFLDLSILTCALFAAIFLVMAPKTMTDMRSICMDCGVHWIGFPFLALVFGKTYKRVWSRSRVSEFATAFLALCTGGVMAFFASELVDPNHTRQSLILMWVYGAFACSGVLGVRGFPRLAQDISVQIKRRFTELNSSVKSTALVYGASQKSTLFLRSRTFESMDSSANDYHVAGLLDDDPNLHGRLVHGYCVLGGIEQLEKIIQKEGVKEIIVCDELEETKLNRLYAIVRYLDVKVLKWEAEVRYQKFSFAQKEMDGFIADFADFLNRTKIHSVNQFAATILKKIGEFTQADAMAIVSFAEGIQRPLPESIWKASDTVDHRVQTLLANVLRTESAVYQLQCNECYVWHVDDDSVGDSMILPLVLQERLVGVLVISDIKKKVFTAPGNRNLVKVLSSELSLALFDDKRERYKIHDEIYATT